MGNSKSKEEVIIAQTAATGPANVQQGGMSHTDYLLVTVILLLVILLVHALYKNCQRAVRSAVRKEINKKELQKVQAST